MRKKSIRLSAIVLLILFAGTALASCAKPLSVQENPLVKEDFLTAKDGRIVNGRGKSVFLQGMNLGGWLLHEYWMTPLYISGYEENINKINNLLELEILQKRFGKQKTLEILDAYQDAWITEWDIQNMAQLGCNVIRVPFWYRNFMWNPEGDWINPNQEQNPGFQRMDWVIATAKKYGMYVILDFHGCPGGQGTNQCSGSSALDLYTHPEYQDAMEKLWVAIAQRYRGEPAVAAYDLMNEPEYVKGDVDIRNVIYDRMYHAVRSVDPEHMITMEACWELDVLPDPQKQGWENVLYQIHIYDEGMDGHIERAVKYREAHNVPIYFGEFRMGALQKDTGLKCRKNDIHFSPWSYKGYSGEEDNWFLYSKERGKPSLNLETDSDSALKRKCKKLQTKSFRENQELLELWKAQSHG